MLTQKKCHHFRGVPILGRTGLIPISRNFNSGSDISIRALKTGFLVFENSKTGIPVLKLVLICDE
jgi:hypothetical protein